MEQNISTLKSLLQSKDLSEQIQGLDQSAVFLENELYEAIIDCGKYLSSDGNVEIIRPYLDHASPEIRSAAIFALSYYWRIPQYEETEKKCIIRKMM